jgi:flagellum-specific peptidoglycan hydrolase FlgJ
MKQICIALTLLLSFSSYVTKAENIANATYGAEDEDDEIVRRTYILSYGALAIEEMKRSAIPASIILAQGILESEWGRASLAKNNNNHFGVKCCTGWRGGCATYSTQESEGVILASFRKYKAVEDSYYDHSEILMNSGRYSNLFNLRSFDYKGWARGLKEYGYAGDERYAYKLIKIIEYNQLYELDAHYTRPIPASLGDVIPFLRTTQKGPVVYNRYSSENQSALLNDDKKKKKKK